MQAEAVLAVGVHQEDGDGDGGKAEGGKHEHGSREVDMPVGGGVLADDISHKHRDEHQADVLYEVDDAVGRAEFPEWHDLGYAWPHRGRDQGESDSVEHHHQ